MKKVDFLEFYSKVVKKLGLRLKEEHREFCFCDNPDSLYEEYLNQKIMLRLLYNKDNEEEKKLLDRHKVCACMTCAIIKVRLLSGNIEDNDSLRLSSVYSVNEQLAFMSGWELFLGFIQLHREEGDEGYKMPVTYHNVSFLDTITRSLFFSNQLNSLSTPLVANIFFLLERYLEIKDELQNLKLGGLQQKEKGV